MLRLVISATLTLWITSSTLILGSTTVNWFDYCGGTLVSQAQDVNGIAQERFDLRTGVTYLDDIVAGQNPISPDGRYRISTARQPDNSLQTITVTALRANTETLLNDISAFATLYWSADSDALLVWEFDNARDVRRLRRIDHQTQHIDFEHEFSRDISTPTITENQQYIYTTYPLTATDDNGSDNGMIFVNTETGALTRFEQSISINTLGDITSGVRFTWSPDVRWLLAQSERGFWVIDPQTGDTHPQFDTIIDGFNPIWVDDNIWFTHVEDYRPMVWKADLATGDITSHWDNAQLYSVSDDETWILIRDHNLDDDLELAFYHFPSQSAYPAELDEHIYVVESQFSPTGRCVAVRTLQSARISRVTVFDLERQSTLNHVDIVDNALKTDLFWVDGQ